MVLLKEVIEVNGKKFQIDLNKDTKINATNITECLVEQPGLVAYYGEIKAQATYIVALVKDELESSRALARAAAKAKAKANRQTKNIFFIFKIKK